MDDKWMARLSAAVQGELDRVSQTLTGRIRELAERYATPLPKLTEEVETLAARVEEHLKKMGAVMEVRPGYKQTEVGVIPEDWEVKHAWRHRLSTVMIGERLLRGACSTNGDALLHARDLQCPSEDGRSDTMT